MSKSIPPIFASWLRPDERNTVMASSLWFPALKMHSRSQGQLVITEAADNTVIFGFNNGLRIARLNKNSQKYSLQVYDAPDSSSLSTMGMSDKPMYLVTRFFREGTMPNEHYKRAMEKADKHLNKMLYYFGYEMVTALKNTLKTNTNYKDMLSQESVKSLIQLFGGQITVHDMDAAERAACERAVKLINASSDNLTQITNTLREAFDRNRWVVTYIRSQLRPDVKEGYYLVAAVNTALTYKEWSGQVQGSGFLSSEKPSHSVIMPLTCYRNFEDIPSEIREDLSTSLIMANLSIKSKEPQVQYIDPNNFVPSGDVISHDANAYVYSISGACSSWITVEKNDTRSEG